MRTRGLVIGAFSALAIASAAGAAVAGEPPQPTTPAVRAQAGIAAPAPQPGLPALVAGAAGAVQSLASAVPDGVITGRQVVGRVEPVRRVLGYDKEQAPTVLRYAGASYMKVHFAQVDLQSGDYLTVSDAHGREMSTYSAGQLHSADDGQWAMSITGDTAVVALHRARGGALGLLSGLARSTVVVDRVARGLTPPESTTQRATERAVTRAAMQSSPQRTGREESVCGRDDKRDAVCYRSSDPVAYTDSKAAVRLLINGTELCTGWRVGVHNRLFTNNHCFTKSADAYNTEVWFDYQCAVCGGYAVFTPTKVWGDSVLATDHTLDFTLFTVDPGSFAKVQKYGYLLLDGRRPVKGDQLIIPQYPGGQPGVIAKSSDVDKPGNCMVADPNYTGYAAGTDVAYYCDTDGGSSGSPVISRRTGRVVALHHFGGCPNSGIRSDLLWQRLKNLL